MERIGKMEELRDIIGAELLLEELVRAMSEDEAKENFDFIKRMYGLNS